jgi:sulfide:quinone oxidoreductase
MPRFRGRAIAGLPQDEKGFVATDEFGRVSGLCDVYAAGDLTQASIKQGGVAAQQADAVASAIAADLGAPVHPTPARPVLRGLLLTGSVPQFLRSEPGTSEMTSQPLWWPPAKLVGRYLSPFLAEQLGLPADDPHYHHEGGLSVEIAVDTHTNAPV